MQDYKCRTCKRYVCASDSQQGRVRVTCHHCGTVNFLFLGNPDGKPLPKALRETGKTC